MDQHIQETTRSIEEVRNEPPNEPPGEILKEAPRETSRELPKEAPKETSSEIPREPSNEVSILVNDMQMKTEPEDQATSPTKFPTLEVSIKRVKPNEELRAVLLDLRKVHNNEDPKTNDLLNEPEQELLDQTDSKEGSGDEQASDEDYESTSDDESDSDEDEPSPDDGSEFDPNESSTKPTKKGPSKKRQRKTRIPSAMNEKVKSLMGSDILSAANANANASGMHQIPVSQKKDKSKALMEEISKLSIEDQPQARKDANALIESSKRFNPSAKIVEMNWQVGGLSTLLKHHQVRGSIKPNL